MRKIKKEKLFRIKKLGIIRNALFPFIPWSPVRPFELKRSQPRVVNSSDFTRKQNNYSGSNQDKSRFRNSPLEQYTVV